MVMEKTAKIKYRRNHSKKCSKIEALSNAQKIAFAPFTFQAVASMLDMGILKFLDGKNADLNEIINGCNISKYTALTLLQVAFYAGIVEKENDKFSLSYLGECFLHDEMTVNNFNFMRDVCYLGASELTESFVNGVPAGLQKYFVNAPTIYPHVPNLPEKARKSWYDFDYFYSDNSFEDVLEIIFKDDIKEIFDIGGNAGKFEKICLKEHPDCLVNIIDLPVNKKIAENNVNSTNLTFHGVDVLSDDKFPQISGAVLMSQFLDCFSEVQVEKILKKVKNASKSGTKVYILEPVIDNQEFEGAAFAISHISLYFTCMANGNSKMYTLNELTSLVRNSGLEIERIHTNVGVHCYTLLECCVK